MQPFENKLTNTGIPRRRRKEEIGIRRSLSCITKDGREERKGQKLKERTSGVRTPLVYLS